MMRASLPALCLAMLMLAVLPARAQEQVLGIGGAGGDGDHRPIQIQADSGIEWHQNAQLYIARGNAVAKRGDSEVHADTLTAYYRPVKAATAAPNVPNAKPPAAPGAKPEEAGSTEIYRVDADGHVVFQDPTHTITGDKAVYDMDRMVVVVTGNNLKLTTPTDVVTARDSLEWYDQKRIAVARGDAVAARADRRIRADVLTAYLTKDTGAAAPDKKPLAHVSAKPVDAAKPAAPDDSGQVNRVDAQGHVLVSTTTDIGRSDFGVYDAKKGIVTLLGNVTLTHGRNVVRGQYAVMDLNTNLSRIMPAPKGGRVEGVFVRQQRGDGTAASADRR
jgi:lipopolysaccharide export system protein LptA